MKKAAGLGLLPRPRSVITLIEPITGAGVGVKLRPELIEFKAVGYTLPELIKLRGKAWPWLSGRRWWWGRGHAGAGIID